MYMSGLQSHSVWRVACCQLSWHDGFPWPGSPISNVVGHLFCCANVFGAVYKQHKIK